MKYLVEDNNWVLFKINFLIWKSVLSSQMCYGKRQQNKGSENRKGPRKKANRGERMDLTEGNSVGSVYLAKITLAIETRISVNFDYY